jgi:hypothetical protein
MITERTGVIGPDGRGLPGRIDLVELGAVTVRGNGIDDHQVRHQRQGVRAVGGLAREAVHRGRRPARPVARGLRRVDDRGVLSAQQFARDWFASGRAAGRAEEQPEDRGQGRTPGSPARTSGPPSTARACSSTAWTGSTSPSRPSPRSPHSSRPASTGPGHRPVLRRPRRPDRRGRVGQQRHLRQHRAAQPPVPDHESGSGRGPPRGRVQPQAGLRPAVREAEHRRAAAHGPRGPRPHDRRAHHQPDARPVRGPGAGQPAALHRGPARRVRPAVRLAVRPRATHDRRTGSTS